MNEIEIGDTVQHNVTFSPVNGGLNMSVEDIQDGKALFVIDEEEHWIPLEELTLIKKATEDGGFGTP